MLSLFSCVETCHIYRWKDLDMTLQDWTNEVGSDFLFSFSFYFLGDNFDARNDPRDD